MDYEKHIEEKQTEQQREYTALLLASYAIMDADDHIGEWVRKKTIAEAEYKKIKSAYYEKYPDGA